MEFLDDAIMNDLFSETEGESENSSSEANANTDAMDATVSSFLLLAEYSILITLLEQSGLLEHYNK